MMKKKLAKKLAAKRKGDEKNAAHFCEKAEAALASFDVDSAVRCYEKALSLEPENGLVLDNFGGLLLELGDKDRAIQLLQKSIEISPEDSHTKYMLMGQLHQGGEAIAFFSRGIEILSKQRDGTLETSSEPQEIAAALASAYCSIAEIFMTDCCMQDNAEAECGRALEAALAVDPSSPEVHQTTASFRISQCNNEEAKKCMMRAIEAINALDDAKKPSYEFRMSTTKVLIELGMYDEAEDVLEVLLEEDDTVVDAWYLMGLCLHWNTDYIAALEHFSKALELAGKQGEDDAEFLAELQTKITECGPLAEKQKAEEAASGAGDADESMQE